MQFDHSTDSILPDDQEYVTFGGTTGVALPSGGMGGRPVSPVAGIVRWNTDIQRFEVYDGATWTKSYTGYEPTYVAIFGNTGMRNNVVKTVNAGGVVTNGSVATVTTTTPHNFVSGTTITLISAVNAPTGFDALIISDIATVTSSTTFTLPSTQTAGTNSSQYWAICNQRMPGSSTLREMMSLSNGRIVPYINASSKAHNVSSMSDLSSFVMSGYPDVIYGDFGLYYSLSNSENPLTYLPILSNLLSLLATSGATIVIEFPSLAISSLTSSQLARTMRALEQVRQLAMQYGCIFVVDRLTPTISSGITQTQRSDLFISSSFEDTNAKSAIMFAPEILDRMSQRSRTYIPTHLPICYRDAGNNANSYQIYQGGWSSTGTDVTTLTTNATGSIDTSATITVTPGSATSSTIAACSIVSRVDNMGYDQVVDITCATAGDNITIKCQGPTASPLAAALVVGNTYQISMELFMSCSDYTAITSFECAFRTSCSYAFGTSNGIPASIFDIDTDLTENNFNTPVAGVYTFPEFTTTADITGFVTAYIQISMTIATPGVTAQIRFGRISIRSV